jgi:hypothetical protein
VLDRNDLISVLPPHRNNPGSFAMLRIVARRPATKLPGTARRLSRPRRRVFLFMASLAAASAQNAVGALALRAIEDREGA